MRLGSLVCRLLISIIFLMNFYNFNGIWKVEHDVKNCTLGARIQVARVQAQGKNSGPASKARYFAISFPEYACSRVM